MLKDIALKMQETLAPHCEQIEIAGSIRRGKENPNDIDLVAIPKREVVQGELFSSDSGGHGPLYRIHQEYVKAVDQWTRLKGQADGLYTRREVDGAAVDIYRAVPDNWGLILTIRTGSRRFNVEVLLPALTRQGLHVTGGRLMQGTFGIAVSDEKALFSWAGLEWIRPEDRE